ncbi:MAG: hypothetical protein ABIT01_18485, partial [Thermoanaerobaculia bacterium]
FPDKIYYLKGFGTVAGDTWDINLVDDQFIYGWITEYAWSIHSDLEPPCRDLRSPVDHSRDYRKSLYNTNVPMTRRWAYGGEPGTVIVTNDDSLDTCVNCSCTASGGNGDFIIHETWGPSPQDLGGKREVKDVIVLKYHYWCWSSDTSSCLRREDFWYEQEFGWVKHIPYTKANDDFHNPWILQEPGGDQGPAWNFLRPEAAAPYFPCF